MLIKILINHQNRFLSTIRKKFIVLKENVHLPSGHSMDFVKNYDQNINITYRAPDCMEKFVRSLKIMIMMIANTKQS